MKNTTSFNIILRQLPILLRFYLCILYSLWWWLILFSFFLSLCWNLSITRVVSYLQRITDILLRQPLTLLPPQLYVTDFDYLVKSLCLHSWFLFFVDLLNVHRRRPRTLLPTPSLVPSTKSNTRRITIKWIKIFYINIFCDCRTKTGKGRLGSCELNWGVERKERRRDLWQRDRVFDRTEGPVCGDGLGVGVGGRRRT